MSGFVVIAEPDDVNRERIRAILESVERKFEYEIVNTAEQAIELVESRKPDVFVGDMKMPVISGTELFSLVELMSPETVRMVMSDALNVKDVVAFMNECKTYKIIIKPCRVADDIITPIENALSYKEMKNRMEQEMNEADMGFFSTEEDYIRMKRTWQENLDDYDRVQKVFAELLECNLNLGNQSPAIKEALKSRYDWMMKEYMRVILDFSGDYEECVTYLLSEGKRFDKGCSMKVRNMADEPIEPDEMKKITYILQLLRRLCGEILYHYEMNVVIESVNKAYILRFMCVLDEAPDEENSEKNVSDTRKEVRDALIKATQKGVDAFAFRSVVINKGKDLIINIAIPRNV